MPLMDGIIATREIVKLYPQIVIIGTSFFTDDITIIREIIKAGAKGFISKNIKINDIPHMLRAIDEGRIYYSPDVQKFINDNIFLKPSKDNLLTTVPQ